MRNTGIVIPLEIKHIFNQLEINFSKRNKRQAWCDNLAKYLLKFEDELEDQNAKYLLWFVSTLRDVFTYNYAKSITQEQLDLLRNGIEIIYKEKENCSKEAFEEYYGELLETGIALLPTTQKAIDEFGEYNE